MQNISYNQLLVLWELVRVASDHGDIGRLIRNEVKEEQGVDCTIDSLRTIRRGLEVYIKDAALLDAHDRLSHGTSM